MSWPLPRFPSLNLLSAHLHTYWTNTTHTHTKKPLVNIFGKRGAKWGMSVFHLHRWMCRHLSSLQTMQFSRYLSTCGITGRQPPLGLDSVLGCGNWIIDWNPWEILASRRCWQTQNIYYIMTVSVHSLGPVINDSFLCSTLVPGTYQWWQLSLSQLVRGERNLRRNSPNQNYVTGFLRGPNFANGRKELVIA